MLLIHVADARLKPMRFIPPRLWFFSLLAAVLQLVPFPLMGPVPLWRRLFCWFCLVPLLVALLGRDRSSVPLRPMQTALLGYTCGIAWYMGNCYWIYQTMHIYGNLPGAVSFGILILFSLYLGLYLALFGCLVGWLRCTYSAKVALYASPFLWVAVELARARITGFPWDLLGYTQVDNAWLTGLAPIGGVMLLSFVIAALNTLFAAGLRVAAKRFQWVIVAVALALVACLQAGTLYHPPPDPAANSAVLLQENLTVNGQGANPTAQGSLGPFNKYREFISLSRAPVTIGPNGKPLSGSSITKHDLIVWPEAPADFATSDPVFRAQLGGLARSTETSVIAGSVGVDFDRAAQGGYREYGSAAVFNSDGSYIGRYDKIHRVPWGEYVPYKELFFFAGKLVANVGNMEAGTQHTIFHLDGHDVGIFICYESIFGDEVRQFTLNGAQVLVNISDDGWYGDSGAPWQHLDMARMRAIENHRWLLRDTNTGVTASIDPHGRGDFRTPRHVRAAFAFPFGYLSGTTFYTRHGDWFAWLCAIVSVLLCAAGYARGSRVSGEA
jgi:apolipoprotein N-acyltransferase